MSIQARLEAIQTRKAILIGFIIWLLAFSYSILIMIGIGVDFSDPDQQFGIGHELYWQFEAIMTPSFIIFTLLFLGWYFRRNQVSSNQAITYGIIIMIMQFLLDLVVLVFLMQSGLMYFYGLVTISYLTIPIWTYLAAKLFVRDPTP
jgi:hypothetical protein